MLISVMSVNFNNSQVGPDVAREDLMNSFMQTSVSSEIGFKYVLNVSSEIGFKYVPN